MKAASHLLILITLLAWSITGLADGASEVKKLLDERPHLCAVVQKYPSVVRWLTDAFDGKFSRSKITFRNDTALRTPFGEHSYDNNGAFVLISREASAVDQVAILIYECVSVQHQDRWNELWAAGASGVIDREQFVIRALEIEHKVALETQKVLRGYFELDRDDLVNAPLYNRILEVRPEFDPALMDYEPNRAARDYYQSVYGTLRKKKQSNEAPTRYRRPAFEPSPWEKAVETRNPTDAKLFTRLGRSVKYLRLKAVSRRWSWSGDCWTKCR